MRVGAQQCLSADSVADADTAVVAPATVNPASAMTRALLLTLESSLGQHWTKMHRTPVNAQKKALPAPTGPVRRQRSWGRRRGQARTARCGPGSGRRVIDQEAGMHRHEDRAPGS